MPKESSAYERNQAIMLLLISDTEFKKDLKRIRQKFHIPKGGFIKNFNDRVVDEKAVEKWNKKMNNQKISPSFLSFVKEVKYLQDKFKMGWHFNEFIGKYVITGLLEAPQNDYQIFFGDSLIGDKIVQVKIFDHLSNAELKKMNKEIQHFTGQYPFSKYKKKVFGLTLKRVLQLLADSHYPTLFRKEGLNTLKEYASAISKFDGDFADMDKEDIKAANKIKTNKNRLQQLRNERFPKTPK